MNSALLKNNLAAIVADSQTRKVLSRSGLIAGFMYIFHRFFVRYSKWSGCDESK